MPCYYDYNFMFCNCDKLNYICYLSGKEEEERKKFFGKVSKEREILSLVGMYSGFGLGGPITEFLELGNRRDYPSWQGGRLVWSVEFSITVKGACMLNTEGA